MPESKKKRLPSPGLLTLAWDLILIMGLTIVILILIASDIAELGLLRLALGLVFVFAAPGYTLQAALFPRRGDLQTLERVGLSIGFSVALIPVLALIVSANKDWGLSLGPMSISLALSLLFFSLIAFFRRFHSRSADYQAPVLNVNPRSWWGKPNRTGRRMFILVAGAITLTLVAATVILSLPKQGEQYTEFYILGSDGLAQSYPKESVAGQELTVTVGIRNMEGTISVYRVEVRDLQGVIGRSEPLALEHSRTSQQKLTFRPLQSGKDVEVTFLLFRDTIKEPYRSLRIFINIKPAS